jgi:hypothetical protein
MTLHGVRFVLVWYSRRYRMRFSICSSMRAEALPVFTSDSVGRTWGARGLLEATCSFSSTSSRIRIASIGSRVMLLILLPEFFQVAYWYVRGSEASIAKGAYIFLRRDFTSLSSGYNNERIFTSCMRLTPILPRNVCVVVRVWSYTSSIAHFTTRRIHDLEESSLDGCRRSCYQSRHCDSERIDGWPRRRA